MIDDRWGTREGVGLHCLVQQGSADRVPLVYVPGSLGRAEEFRAEMGRLAPRATLAVDKRGVVEGESAPEVGYAFEDRVADLEAVVADAALGPACVMAFSLGVPVAIRYAARHPGLVRGLILLDHPARYPARDGAWLERAIPFARERGIPELRLEVFEDAGHEVFRPDYERFMRVIEGFLQDLDAR